MTPLALVPLTMFGDLIIFIFCIAKIGRLEHQFFGGKLPDSCLFRNSVGNVPLVVLCYWHGSGVSNDI